FIAEKCQFQLDELRYEYPDETVPATMTAQHYLCQETWQGAQRRYPGGIPKHVKKQIQQELAIINKLQYEGYFLTVYDIVQFARSRGILCQGRGSAANSAVCYCLGITEVDPESGHLLFARFISQERNEPPDIDIDFEHDRREEVIQYIYQKYGRSHAALTAVVIQYRLRSALRDVGKALTIKSTLIDAVCPLARYCPDATALLALMQEKDIHQLHTPTLLQQWASLAWMLQRFPRHLSQHPGGFVIAHQPLHQLVPLENAAMKQRTIVQWDKDDLDIMGMLKIDVLGLGILGVLRRCLEMLSVRQGRAIALQD